MAKKKNNDKRINLILVGVIIVLLLVLVGVIVSKTTKSNKNKNGDITDRSTSYQNFVGKWYQEYYNENVYVEVLETSGNKVTFNFKASGEFRNVEAVLVDGKANIMLNNDDGEVQVILEIKDNITIRVVDSNNQYYSAGEEYTFLVNEE